MYQHERDTLPHKHHHVLEESVAELDGSDASMVTVSSAKSCSAVPFLSKQDDDGAHAICGACGLGAAAAAPARCVRPLGMLIV